MTPAQQLTGLQNCMPKGILSRRALSAGQGRKMLEKVKILLRKVLIYASLGLLIVPASFFLMLSSAPHAQAAAEKTPPQKITKTAPAKEREPIEKKEAKPLKAKTSPKTEREPQIIRLKSAIKETDIFLAWGPIKGANGYLVEWSAQGGNSLQMKVVQKTQISLEGLTPGTNYDIKISSVSSHRELSTAHLFTFKTRGIAPAVPLTVAKKITPRIGTGVSTSQVSQNQPAPKEVIPNRAPAEPKTNETQKKGWSRLLVALAILIIAAGVAVGGYYGYEWWAQRGEEEEPPSSKSDSRW